MTELLLEPGARLAPDGLPGRPSTAGRRTPQPPNGTPRTTLILFGGAAIVAAGALMAVLLNAVPQDYLTYRYAAQAALHGADIYQHNVAGPLLNAQPFTYTPFAAVVLIPTTLLSWRVSYLLWSAGLLTALWAVVRAVLPTDLHRRGLIGTAFTVAAAATCIGLSNLGDGQIDILLMALCLGDLLRRGDTWVGRLVPRGVLIGVATAIKLTPALFIVYFLLTRQWRRAAASVAGAAAATVLGAVVFPQLTATFAAQVLWSLTSRVAVGHPLGYWGNSSLTGAIHALGPWAAPLVLPAVLAAAAACLAAAVRSHRRGAELNASLIIGLAAPVLSPFAWEHHFVYLIPALATLGRAALVNDRVPPWDRPRIALAVALLVGLCLGPDVGSQLLALHMPWLTIPGVLLREILLLTSLGCIAALAHQPVAHPQQTSEPVQHHQRAEQPYGVGASPAHGSPAP